MRLDQALKAHGFYASREKAQAAIAKGQVKMGGRVIKKASTPYDGSLLECQNDPVYVSRSAQKLKAALDHFNVSLTGQKGLDIGASTGGFTEVALEYGARHVLALDVGRDQLVESLKNDSRVTSLEQTHILHVETLDPVDFVLIDVSFISSLKVLTHIHKITTFDRVFVLFKPQFETEEKLKHPVIKDKLLTEKLIQHYTRSLRAMGYIIQNTFMPIKGKEGNQELMYYLTR